MGSQAGTLDLAQPLVSLFISAFSPCALYLFDRVEKVENTQLEEEKIETQFWYLVENE